MREMVMTMDPRIWSKLPDHLLEHVLSFLPLKTFLSLRPTCRRFNSLLFTPSFISRHRHGGGPSTSSFLLLSHPHFPLTSPLFNTTVSAWSTVLLPYPPLPPSSLLVASSHGLLCFSAPSSASFLVFDLLRHSLRRINFPTSPFSSDLPSLIPSPSSSSYKLFTLSHVYDSASASWARFGAPQQILNENPHQRGVLYKGGLHFTTPEPFHVVTFNAEGGEGGWGWGRPPMDLPRGLTFTRLAGDGGRKLYLVGGVGARGISRSIKVWEVAEDGERWEEVETMPETVCRKFLSVCYHNYEHVYCFWHQGLICLCCYTWPEILYYRVSRMTWHWLPKCPSLPDKWSCGFRWFSFTPQLYASV